MRGYKYSDLIILKIYSKKEARADKIQLIEGIIACLFKSMPFHSNCEIVRKFRVSNFGAVYSRVLFLLNPLLLQLHRGTLKFEIISRVS